MNLRRDIRKAIQSGSSVFATVEEYHNGYATVRLAEHGARLTNLSTQGAVVKAGDKVTIDYSAGVKPVVRPLFIPEYEPVLLDLDEGREVTMMDDDWSCAVYSTIQIGYGRDPEAQPAYPAYSGTTSWIFGGIPDKIVWADNYMWLGTEKYGGSCERYDVAEGPEGMYNENEDYGCDYIEIKRTGRYLITGLMEWDAVGNSTKSYAWMEPGDGYGYDAYGQWWCMTGTPEGGENDNPTGLDGHFWVAVLKNDIIVAKITNRTYEDDGFTFGGYDVYMLINAIVWCNYGDRISLGVFQNQTDGPFFAGWGFPASGTTGSNGLKVVYIPGSERAIYQASSSQSAYMKAHSQAQHAYLDGGGNWKQSAYLRGSKIVGWGDPPPSDCVIPAYLEGGTGAGGGDFEGSQNCYLSGN